MPSSRRRKAPIGVSRSAGRVARRRSVSALLASRLAWLRLSGSGVVIAGPRESDTTDRPRDERSCLPRCHPHSAMPHSRDRRVGFPTDRRCPVSLALCAGAYLGDPVGGQFRSVRRLPGPFAAAVAPVSTSHRVSLPTLDGYSSRSQPALRDVGGVCVERRGASSVGGSAPGRAVPRIWQNLHPGTVMSRQTPERGQSCTQ